MILSKYRHNEAGSVLVVGMLTLVLLTLVGFAATRTASLETETSGNEKTYQQAFYAAELGLVVGENTIEALSARPDLNEGTTPGRFNPGVLSFDHTSFKLVKNLGGSPQPVQWNSTDSAVMANVPTGLEQVAAPPRYTIAERTFQGDTLSRGITYGETGIYYFDVIARGTGGNSAANVLVQSVYAKRF